MTSALLIAIIGLAALIGGVLIGRYYVPDSRAIKRAARHGRACARGLSALLARDVDRCIEELTGVVEENVTDVEPYFALGALFRNRGEHERAIRVHQAIAVRADATDAIKARAQYELGLDFRAAGFPRRAARALEDVIAESPKNDRAVRALAALYEEWLEGRHLLDYKEHDLADRNHLAQAMFRAWWYPFSHYGVIHGDPHLGNYTVFETDGRPARINLLDYGCIRTFPVAFVEGVVEL